MFNMFQTAGQPMATEQAEEQQGETSPGDTHDNVDQEDATPLPMRLCHKKQFVIKFRFQKS